MQKNAKHSKFANYGALKKHDTLAKHCKMQNKKLAKHGKFLIMRNGKQPNKQIVKNVATKCQISNYANKKSQDYAIKSACDARRF